MNSHQVTSISHQ